MATTQTLTIKDWVDATNLNTVNWRKTTLKRIANEYNLYPGECVVFENAKREKARLVANIGGLVALLIPPIDPTRQLSVHLEINEYLRALAGTHKMRKACDARREEIKERIARRKRLKERARRRRAKKK
jgi:hypothetical protein